MRWFRKSRERTTFKAVAMDIDGTLTTCDTLSLTSGILGLPGSELAVISRGYQDGSLSTEQVHALVLGRWKSSGKANRTDLEGIFRSLPVRADAGRLIKRIEKLSLGACLITSSMDYYAQVMCDRLGVADFFANVRLYFDENAGELRDMEFTKDAAGLKRKQILEYCANRGLRPSEVMVIGNAENDLEMFEVTGNGVLLSDDPEGPLSAAAWRTVGSLAEAADLL
ncbi:hypothetical protein GCM10027589_20810 [Actinocorallia lasiicapitis]